MSDLPRRKRNRLPEYDYNTSGRYFITVCTEKKEKILSSISVGATIGRPPIVHLSYLGRIVEEAIQEIPKKYSMIMVDHYVIMPNHVHLLLSIIGDDGRPMVAPTISRVIQQMKGYVTKRAEKPIWQKGFYDHVVRTEHDYRSIYEYIDNNPAHWAEDVYYCGDTPYFCETNLQK